MSQTTLLQQIDDDLREAPAQTVIYLEGKTDLDFFFALIGLRTPSDGLHQGVLVKGLRDEGQRRGSGATAVMGLIDTARRFNRPRVFGIVDGDGLSLDLLKARFDPPYLGPLFSWKAYCIENQLAKTGWPKLWGDEIDWQSELSKYGPYVALNQIGRDVRAIIKQLGLENFNSPILGSPIRTSSEILVLLSEGTARFQSFNLDQRFLEELSTFIDAVARDLNQAHVQLNGKWLVRHMAPTLTKRDPDQCRFDWIAHAVSVGGRPEVCDWWKRITGSPP
jgi:hypothetical protein